MATRSAIVEITPDGEYRAIYCHNDGYPEHNGLRLVNYYDTAEKVKELIDLGFISYLAKRVKPEEGEEHSFDKPVEDVTVAYHRDREESYENMQPVHGKTLSQAIRHMDCAYVYLFRNNEWYVDGNIDDEDKYSVLVKSLDLETKYL